MGATVRAILFCVVGAAAVSSSARVVGEQPAKPIVLTPLGQYQSFKFDQVGAEVAGYDPHTRRLFVVNVAQARIDVLDIADPLHPFLTMTLDVTPYGSHANSVAVHNGLVAVGVQALVKTDPGKLVFFDAYGEFLNAVTVGALPDCVTFTPNGALVLVANEGEPNNAYTIDPEGTVSIVNLAGGVERLTDQDVIHVGFSAFNNQTLDPSIRVFGPGASVAQDLEPEFIVAAPDSQTAWVTLQENNAIAVINLRGIRSAAPFEVFERLFQGQSFLQTAGRQDGRVSRLAGLGFKDHSAPGQGLDASDTDGAINIRNWPVLGMFDPDALATFVHRGQVYLASANEGDVREYAGFNASGNEARRVGSNSVVLDPTSFPTSASLKQNSALGRLNVTGSLGDTDGDGDFDKLYAFGGRSFSIWTEDVIRVFDSGDSLERLTAAAFPSHFNASNTNNTFDNRSDDKGPEPEGIATASLFGRTYLFVVLERIGGVAVYDVGTPTAPTLVQYINTRDFTVTPSAASASDLGPESVLVIEAHASPIHQPLLVVSNEVSGTVRIFQIAQVK